MFEPEMCTVRLILPNRDISPMCSAVLDNLYRFVVPAIAGPSRLLPLAALATPELTTGGSCCTAPAFEQ
jgi:hypothetical protein